MISLKTRSVLAILTPMIVAGLAAAPTANASKAEDLKACMRSYDMSFCCPNVGGTYEPIPPYDGVAGKCWLEKKPPTAQQPESNTSQEPTKPGQPPASTVPVTARQ